MSIDDPLAMLLRSSCDDCGSDKLVWCTLSQLVTKVPLEDRSGVFDLLAMLGGECTAWRCRRCGMYGVFGPTFYG